MVKSTIQLSGVRRAKVPAREHERAVIVKARLMQVPSTV